MEPSDFYLSDLGLFLTARWQEWGLQVSRSMERDSGASTEIKRWRNRQVPLDQDIQLPMVEKKAVQMDSESIYNFEY